MKSYGCLITEILAFNVSVNTDCWGPGSGSEKFAKLRGKIDFQVISFHARLYGVCNVFPKIEAASVTKKANIETCIVNGLEDNFILNAFENKVPFTKIK